jgi:hypothetical protein
VLSAWRPQGALADVAAARRRALAELGDPPPGGASFAWHDADALSSLLTPHGFSPPRISEHAIDFRERSVEAFVERELRDHPLWAGARERLEAEERFRAVRSRVAAILGAANEDPQAFKITGRYVIAAAQRP